MSNRGSPLFSRGWGRAVNALRRAGLNPRAEAARNALVAMQAPSTPGFDLVEHTARIEADGFTVIPDLLTAADLAEVRCVLAFYLGSHTGRNDFEGTRTERVYTLVARGRIFWRIALDPRVMALCGRFLLPGFLLTASQAIRIHPGETPQPFHTDDSFYTIPRPRPMVSLSTIIAVDAFTADNGGTEVVPGSHRWDDAALAGSYDLREHETPEGAAATAAFEARARAIEMPAGGCVVFAGTLLHRGGRNASMQGRSAVSHQYCQPWGRQQENFTLGIPAAVARDMPPRLQELLGYSIHPPFMGQLSGSHPRKALAGDYGLPVVEQARAAGARLPE